MTRWSVLKFKRLDEWVLVPAPDNIKPLTLKWLFKNKHDEENKAIRTKRSVLRGYTRGRKDFENLRSWLLEWSYQNSFAIFGETVNMGLWYTKDSGFDPMLFSFADYARACKFTSRVLRSELISLVKRWLADHQKSKTVRHCQPRKQNMCLYPLDVPKSFGCRHSSDYGFHFHKIPIYYDSKSAIAISCNMVQHSRIKHIVVRYHFIKEHMEKGHD
ncbi:hypothetical protein Tco_0413541 [Tanacetum coccineum]